MTSAELTLEDGRKIEVSIELGQDGTLVLFIDTPELDELDREPRMRVYINDDDEPIYANPDWNGDEEDEESKPDARP